MKPRLAGDWANRPVIREIHLRELSSVIDRSSHLVMPVSSRPLYIYGVKHAVLRTSVTYHDAFINRVHFQHVKQGELCEDLERIGFA